MKKTKKHVLFRIINEDRKGLFISYGGCHIRRILRSKKSKFHKGDGVRVIMDRGYDNEYKVTQDEKYFETWRIPTVHITRCFIRKTRKDEKGLYVRFMNIIFRQPKKHFVEHWVPLTTCFRYVSPDKIEANPGWPFQEVWLAE